MARPATVHGRTQRADANRSDGADPLPAHRHRYNSGFSVAARISSMKQPFDVLETIREGAEFTLHRGRERYDSIPVLVVAPAVEPMRPESLRRLEHEYSLSAELDPAWAAKPI